MIITKISDDFVLSGLMKLDPEVIDSVFYRESEYRAHMEMAIKEMWNIKKEYISVVIMSFCHYVTSNNFKRIKQWRTLSKKNRIPLIQILQDALLEFLANRIEFKGESQSLYAVLTGSNEALPFTLTRLNGKDSLKVSLG